MGDAPPINYPSPEDTDIVDAGFQPGPPVASLCGFTLPFFIPFFKLKLPSLNFPPPFDFMFSLSIGINCDLNNPLDISAKTPFGGGAILKAPQDPDQDPNFI